MQQASTRPHLTYRPGLDGLRAIAVAGVFFYHARVDWMPGGFLGVDLFFVLSGYLITSLLLVEWESRGRIDLRRFWIRRARRLLPALVVVVLASLLLASAFARDDLARTRSDAINSLLYFENWHLIIANHSYFNLMGRPSLLQHLWSLAVEEQFYLFWPILLALGLVAFGRKRLPLLVVGGIAGSTILMWLLYNPEADPSRVYYGTDTRAATLLVGILLAFGWKHVERIRKRIPALELLGLAALVYTIYLFRNSTDFDPRYYRGGSLIAAVVFAVLIAEVAYPPSRLGRALGAQPLRWIGERSYGIYLWHWPVIALTRPGVDISWTGPGLVVFQAAIVVAAAALSYRFIEQPIRTGTLQRQLAQVQFRRRLELVGMASAALVAAFAVLFFTPAAVNPVTSYVNPPTAKGSTTHPPTGIALRRFWIPKPTGTAKQVEHTGLPPGRILALGDSVMLGCSPELKTALRGHVKVDAVVGRQIDDTIKELARFRDRGVLPKTVVIQVGNNGPLWYRDLVRLRHALRGIPDVVVVNVRNSTDWQSESNQAIGQWVKNWPVAHVADWYGHSKPSMLSDGTHPWPRACTIYARVIADTLRQSA